MFQWTADKIRFLRDAANYLSCYDRLAEQISRYLSPDAHVCDAGCGLGHLSLALAAHCRQVTAIDWDPEALQVLAEEQARRGLTNLHVRCGDIHRLAPKQPYQAMVFCSFGRPAEILSLAAAQCSGTVVAVKRRRVLHRFRLEAAPCQHGDFDLLRQQLTRRHIAFQQTSFSLEMGQPFRSLADAVLFFQAYAQSDAVITADVILPHLQETDSPAFPYFLPRQQTMELLTFSTAALASERTVL